MPVTKSPYPHSPSSYGLDRPVARRVRYVDSTASNASNDNLGDSWLRPLATREGVFSGAYAAAETTAGTVVYVAPGHSETIIAAAGLDADIAGVTIVGLGVGRNRPTINFSTATTADIDIDAANIMFENFHIDLTGIDALVAPLDVNAADFTLKNCEILMADSGGQAAGFIITATGSHRMKLIDCIILSPDVGAEDAIDIVGTPDGIELINTRIIGDFLNAPVYNATGNIATNLLIKGGHYQNDQAGDHAIELVSAVTGLIQGAVLVTDAIATAADLGSLKAVDVRFFDSSDVDATGTSYPETVTTGGHDLAAIEGKADVIDGYFDVPTADASTDATIRDVVGRKTDAAQVTVAATRTLMAYIKGLMNSTVRTIEKIDGAVLTGKDPLFTITGGPIRVKNITGIVTTTVGGSSNGNLGADVTTPAGTVALSTTVAIDNDAAGTSYIFVGASGVLTPLTNGATILDMSSATVSQAEWIVPIGNIHFEGSAAQTGVIKWYMTYEPISPSAVVTAAA